MPFNVTSLKSQVMYDDAAAIEWVVDSLKAQVLIRPAVDHFVTSLKAQVAIRADGTPTGGRYHTAQTPNAEDQDVIYSDLIFPQCVTYGSTGVPLYLTDKIEVDSGAEQRNQRRDFPKYQFNILLDNLPADEMKEVLNLWHVCAGDFIAFLFLDPMDHTSANDEKSITSTETSMTDQFVGVAVGGKSEYELFKYYKKGSRSKARRIRYPILDENFVVAVDGFEFADWQYSYGTRKLTVLQPVASVTKTLSRSGGNVFTGANFSALKPGSLIYMDGWTAGNAPQGGNPLRVLSADGTTLVVQRFNGGAYNAADETAVEVTYKSAGIPVGAEITAGFYFYVPVRFVDGAVMQGQQKSGLRETAIGSFTSVALVEVFE